MNSKKIIRLLFTFCLCGFVADSNAQSDSSFQFLRSIKGKFFNFR